MGPSPQIAHYRILSKLGEGGMGAVYRATDTKLGRDVAIKVLPPAFADDSARMQRFEREAQVLASLNHPNIAAIYGIEQGAIVMEMVDGQDLAGPVPVETAIAYAKQIAAALEAAHEKGIVHRDLKPSNIKVTATGLVKLRDFGLAKATEEAGAASGVSPTMSPTLSLAMTQAGMILGTAAYMAPEQARGRPVDKRADIWAFAVVLYEMLTGTQLFASGETVTDIIAAVVTREPDWNALPKDTPPRVRRLIERCLRKDSRQRLRDIGDARIALDEAEPESPEAVVSPTSRATGRWWAIAAAVGIAAARAFWAGWRAAYPAPAPLVRITMDLGPDSVAGPNNSLLFSPDGHRIASYVHQPDGTILLATRLLSDAKVTPLVGTENVTDAFFSPDGEWVGFFASGKLMKIPALGGAATILCDAPNPRGGTWLPDGTIVFTPSTTNPLLRIKDTGGATQPVTSLGNGGQRTHRWPQVLPGRKALLFTAHTTATQYDDAEIDVLDLKTRQTKTVVRGGFFGRYVPSGHILYASRGSMFAMRFDLARMQASGTPLTITDDVAVNPISAGGQFDFSSANGGTLAYLPGSPNHQTGGPVQWMNAAGETQVLLPISKTLNNERLSPDGRLLALGVGLTISSDIYVLDIARGTLSQLTFNGQSNTYPVWAPDGKHLVYVSKPESRYIIWWSRADGAGQARKLFETPDAVSTTSFSPDGRHLAYQAIGNGTGGDLWTLPLDLKDPENPQPGTPEVFLQTPRSEVQPRFSPDGRWIAYGANDSGRNEIYVRPFPGPGGKWVISSEGGQHPVWSRAGHQLFYEKPDGGLVAVDYEVHDDTFVPGQRHPFAESRRLVTGVGPNYDISLDGKRIVGKISDVVQKDPREHAHIVVLMNFFDELRRKL
jgi:serine/threonine protein kinase